MCKNQCMPHVRGLLLAKKERNGLAEVKVRSKHNWPAKIRSRRSRCVTHADNGPAKREMTGCHSDELYMPDTTTKTWQKSLQSMEASQSQKELVASIKAAAIAAKKSSKFGFAIGSMLTPPKCPAVLVIACAHTAQLQGRDSLMPMQEA